MGREQRGGILISDIRYSEGDHQCTRPVADDHGDRLRRGPKEEDVAAERRRGRRQCVQKLYWHCVGAGGGWGDHGCSAGDGWYSWIFCRFRAGNVCGHRLYLGLRRKGLESV